MSALPLIRLDLNDGDRLLTAVYKPPEPGSDIAPPTLELLIQVLAQRGWSREALDPAQANDFIKRCESARESVLGVIGAVHNGRYELSATPNKMSVSLALWAPKGGQPVSQGTVRQALADMEIVYGLNESVLTEIFERGHAEPTVIAQGTPPILGTATVFRSLLDSLQTHDEFDDDSPVDYRSLGKILLVTPGTKLMKRIPPTPGVDGFNVQGQPLPAPVQPDTPFSDKTKGAAPADNDPNTLLALIAGQPLVVQNGIDVNPVLEVDEVNLATGNIVFDGSLRVNGDITSGMTVQVSGDVVVQGTIEAALVEAGGNITVNGGIIGTADHAAGNAGGDAPRTARIRCGGEVKARFIENAIVDAQCSVNAQHQIRSSRIASSNTVQVGALLGSRSGVIMGGVVRAWASIYAGTIGSPAGFSTVVQAGLDPHADMKHASLAKKRAHLEEERAKLEKILSFLQANPTNAPEQVKQRAKSTYEKLMVDLKTTEEERIKLHRDLIPLATANITALQRFCGGVTIQIGGKTLNFLEEKLGGKVCLDDEGELAIRASNR